MTFTIVHIAIAFTVGYILGAIGMWIVQRIRKEPDAVDYLEDHSPSIPTSQFEGRTRHFSENFRHFGQHARP